MDGIDSEIFRTIILASVAEEGFFFFLFFPSLKKSLFLFIKVTDLF